jgi:hypothetical protein
MRFTPYHSRILKIMQYDCLPVVSGDCKSAVEITQPMVLVVGFTRDRHASVIFILCICGICKVLSSVCEDCTWFLQDINNSVQGLVKGFLGDTFKCHVGTVHMC